MSMKQNKDIQIGTCMPGTESEKWLPAFLSAGFETLSVNYHMSFSGVDIERQGPELKVMADEKGVRISTLGVYSNPIQLKAHVRQLERAIDAAKLYGADTVATFAGAYEGKPVEESFKRFGEVFRDLCGHGIMVSASRLRIARWMAPGKRLPATSPSIPGPGR
jgi:sugar phosphate isomerase/epimerase